MEAVAEVAREVAGEFADLSLPQAAVLTTRLLVAGFLGVALGWERERAHKSAGRRTHILVAVGSAAFVAVTQQAGLGTDAVSRVVQGLLAGIGFLGAGCIVKSGTEGHVVGLTTAAGIWMTAAVGVAAGLGRETSAVVIGLLGWFTLAVLGRWEKQGQAGPNGSGSLPGP
ncbi:MAG: methyltransferase [Gemmataceae bacterium]|nr:methyltransferase [Gemmataceae bacterium]